MKITVNQGSVYLESDNADDEDFLVAVAETFRLGGQLRALPAGGQREAIELEPCKLVTA